MIDILIDVGGGRDWEGLGGLKPSSWAEIHSFRAISSKITTFLSRNRCSSMHQDNN